MGLKPSAWPSPWQIIRSLRRAVTAGFFCRSEPAALLRGIGERRLALLDEAGVERLEVREPEEHLAAHLEHLGHRELLGAGQRLGDVLDGAGVERDVLAGATVAAGGRPDQLAVAVHQRQRDAVDLQLAQVVRVVADLTREPRRPRRRARRG